jgi:epoxyqueuosine reductase
MINATAIKEYAYELGFDSVRITGAAAFPGEERVIKQRIAEGLMDGLPWFTARRAEISCQPAALLPEARSIIALALCYLSEQPAGEQSGPPRGRISRYAWGDDYHDLITSRLQQFTAWLAEYTRTEVPQLQTHLFVDTGRMVDRAVARRAGLGWYGKNTNILTRGWGSWVFLAEVVTNLPLQEEEFDQPLQAHCGKCEICLHACPTGALPAPYVLDNRRCISYLTIELRGSIPLELRPLMGNLIFGCDICQEVCPVNQVAERRLGLRLGTAAGTPLLQIRPRPTFHPRASLGSNPELIPLLKLTEEEFRERFRGSPIKRAKRRGLLRNVCVALGNSKDLAAVPALCEALHHEEALVRGHAAWALGQLGGKQAREALEEASGQESEIDVRQEICCALQTGRSWIVKEQTSEPCE